MAVDTSLPSPSSVFLPPSVPSSSFCLATNFSIEVPTALAVSCTPAKSTNVPLQFKPTGWLTESLADQAKAKEAERLEKIILEAQREANETLAKAEATAEQIRLERRRGWAAAQKWKDNHEDKERETRLHDYCGEKATDRTRLFMAKEYLVPVDPALMSDLPNMAQTGLLAVPAEEIAERRERLAEQETVLRWPGSTVVANNTYAESVPSVEDGSDEESEHSVEDDVDAEGEPDTEMDQQEVNYNISAAEQFQMQSYEADTAASLRLSAPAAGDYLDDEDKIEFLTQYTIDAYAQGSTATPVQEKQTTTSLEQDGELFNQTTPSQAQHDESLNQTAIPQDVEQDEQPPSESTNSQEQNNEMTIEPTTSPNRKKVPPPQAGRKRGCDEYEVAGAGETLNFSERVIATPMKRLMPGGSVIAKDQDTQFRDDLPSDVKLAAEVHSRDALGGPLAVVRAQSLLERVRATFGEPVTPQQAEEPTVAAAPASSPLFSPLSSARPSPAILGSSPLFTPSPAAAAAAVTPSPYRSPLSAVSAFAPATPSPLAAPPLTPADAALQTPTAATPSLLAATPPFTPAEQTSAVAIPSPYSAPNPVNPPFTPVTGGNDDYYIPRLRFPVIRPRAVNCPPEMRGFIRAESAPLPPVEMIQRVMPPLPSGFSRSLGALPAGQSPLPNTFPHSRPRPQTLPQEMETKQSEPQTLPEKMETGQSEPQALSEKMEIEQDSPVKKPISACSPVFASGITWKISAKPATPARSLDLSRWNTPDPLLQTASSSIAGPSKLPGTTSGKKKKPAVSCFILPKKKNNKADRKGKGKATDEDTEMDVDGRGEDHDNNDTNMDIDGDDNHGNDSHMNLGGGDDHHNDAHMDIDDGDNHDAGDRDGDVQMN
ncbi:hypothetical protein B0T22DRAFT_81374 [Podospora appendiculata]|uniref:Uncharacterized protein n=1 Tax=Podospora appendiculata TaxID=314037 RepID=A0AAE0XJU8_9PEZI|nr:hypothetical protein B0T22DRAFT_81374 [Podospora appendiculata]